jgi:glycosyltransferase involved in cell wall biosynthesis
MRIIANMVARNEADRFLPEVLEHLNGIVDEIVFSDDYSTDNSVQVAKEAGAHVYESPWKHAMFTEHEARLRQWSWTNLEAHAQVGDWILAIDADEKLYETFDEVSIRNLVEETNYDVINIKFVHMWDEKHFRIDKLWKPNNSFRLFRFREGGTYRYRKLACGAEPSYVIDAVRSRRYLVQSGLVMQHLGYQKDEDKKMKYDRYMTLDKGEFHNIDHLVSIMDSNVELVEWKFS